MVSRRDLLKGGTAVAGAVALGGRAVGAGAAASREGDLHDMTLSADAEASSTDAWWRVGGAGPRYWSTYGYNNATQKPIPEAVWAANVDWVASTFRPHGYDMVVTDGWIDATQRTTPNGYILSLGDDWAHDWSWWVARLATKGLKLGVYYNPMWAVRSAVLDRSITVIGRPDVPVADLVDPADPLNAGTPDLGWIDVTHDGAEEYVKGYVDYFRQLGAALLRVDFLAWYESGFDQGEGTRGIAHGREGYLTALRWMREAAGPMKLSLVMPNLYDHGSGERMYGDMIRIDNDVDFGTFFHLSGGRQTWQPEWSQWDNPFLGFTGFADISGPGQLTLDGDPLIMASFTSDAERRTAINLFTMAGAAIAIADRHDTIGASAAVYCNDEVLALGRQGLVGKPVFHDGHDLSIDPKSRDPERWLGQLPDGSWAIGLFNRGETPATRAVDFRAGLGLTRPALVRDLWAHRDLGPLSRYEATLAPHASVLVLVTPREPIRYQAEFGARTGSARFDNVHAGRQAMGYVTGLDAAGAGAAVLVDRATAGPVTLTARVGNATGRHASLTVRSLDPATGQVRSTAALPVAPQRSWATWVGVPVTLTLAAGQNLLTFTHEDDDTGRVDLDSFTLDG